MEGEGGGGEWHCGEEFSSFFFFFFLYVHNIPFVGGKVGAMYLVRYYVGTCAYVAKVERVSTLDVKQEKKKKSISSVPILCMYADVGWRPAMWTGRDGMGWMGWMYLGLGNGIGGSLMLLVVGCTCTYIPGRRGLMSTLQVAEVLGVGYVRKATRLGDEIE